MTRPRLCRCGHRWPAHSDQADVAPCTQCPCRDYTPGKVIPKRKSPERDAMRGVVQVMKLAGFRVWSTVQGYRAEPGGTRMSPGLPDYYCLHPMTGHSLWIEGKSRTGRLRPAQVAFRDLHARCPAVPPVMEWRSRADAEHWLRRVGLLTADGRYPCARGAE